MSNNGGDASTQVLIRQMIADSESSVNADNSRREKRESGKEPWLREGSEIIEFTEDDSGVRYTTVGAEKA